MITRTDYNTASSASKSVRAWSAGLLGISLLALAGCNSNEGFTPGCPNVAIVRDAGTYRMPGTDGQVAATAVMSSVRALCEYEDTGVTVNAVMTVTASPIQGQSVSSVPVEYFVAVLDPARNVLAKQIFGVTVPINGDTGAVAEELVQFIPAPKTVDARYYEVLVGFQLPAEQVEANRRMNEVR